MQLKFAIQNIVGYEVFETQTAAQQVIGREGETATLLSRCLVTLSLRGGGFAPRHLNRSMPRGKIQFYIWLTKLKDLIHLQSLLNLLNEFRAR